MGLSSHALWGLLPCGEVQVTPSESLEGQALSSILQRPHLMVQPGSQLRSWWLQRWSCLQELLLGPVPHLARGGLGQAAAKLRNAHPRGLLPGPGQRRSGLQYAGPDPEPTESLQRVLDWPGVCSSEQHSDAALAKTRC